MKRQPNKTPISEIVDYWAPRIDECDLSVDWSEAEEYCWNCGSPKELTRCHIVPHSLGGADKPSNYVLLCRACHEEAPNVADPRIMWDWLAAHKSSFYRTYWVTEGQKEYQLMYGRSVEQELGFILDGIGHDNPSERDPYEALMEEAIMQSVHHFGQSAPNKATAAGIMRMFLLKYAKEHGRVLPDARPKRLTPPEYFS